MAGAFCHGARRFGRGYRDACPNKLAKSAASAVIGADRFRDRVEAVAAEEAGELGLDAAR